MYGMTTQTITIVEALTLVGLVVTQEQIPAVVVGRAAVLVVAEDVEANVYHVYCIPFGIQNAVPRFAGCLH